MARKSKVLDKRLAPDMHFDRMRGSVEVALAERKKNTGGDVPDIKVDDDPVLSEVHQAARNTARGAEDLLRRLDIVDADETRTDAEKTRLKNQIVEKHAGSPNRALTNARTRAVNEIVSLENQITEAMRSRLTAEEAQEIRAFVRQQPNPKQFVQDAAMRGDADTVAAALGSKAYLSGLTADDQAKLRPVAEHGLAGEAAARRDAIRAAVDALETVSARYVETTATLVDRHEAEKLEKQRQDTDAALSKPLSTGDAEPEPEDTESADAEAV